MIIEKTVQKNFNSTVPFLCYCGSSSGSLVVITSSFSNVIILTSGAVYFSFMLFTFLSLSINISLSGLCINVGCLCHIGEKLVILGVWIAQNSVNVGQSTAAVIFSINSNLVGSAELLSCDIRYFIVLFAALELFVCIIVINKNIVAFCVEP